MKSLLAKISALLGRLDEAVAAAAGRQLLTLPVFLTGLISSTLLRVLGTPFNSEGSLIEQVSIGWLTFGLYWVWIQLVSRALLRLSRWGRYLVVASVLFGAAGRGAMVHLLINDQNREPVELLGYRMLSSVLLVGCLMLLASYALYVMRRQTARLDQLQAYRKTLTESLEQSSVELMGWFASLVESAKLRMRDHLRREAASSKGSFSENLKSLITEVVRPLSSELARAIPPTPKISQPNYSNKHSWATMVRAASTMSWQVRPVLTPVSIGLISIPSVYIFGNASAPEVFLGFGLLQWAGLSIVNWIFSRRPATWSALRGAILLQVLILLANLLPAYYTVWWIGFLERRPDYFHNSAMILTVGFSVVTLLISTVDATSRGVRQSESDLRDTVESLRWHLAKIKGEMWRRQQALARALHGPLQAGMTADSIRIDLEMSPARKLLMEQQAEESTLLAIDSLEIELTEGQVSERDFDAIVDRWRGICEIHISLKDEVRPLLRRDPSAARILLDLLHDALSNSVRHGAASEVKIEVRTHSPDLLHVSVADNGVGLKSEVGEGVGSYHLDVLTTEWTIRNAVSPLKGARLEFLLPVSVEDAPNAQFTESGFLG